MTSNRVPVTSTSGTSGRVLYVELIAAPYAPAVMKAIVSPAASGGRTRSRVKVSVVSQTGPTTSVGVDGAPRAGSRTGKIRCSALYIAGRTRSFIAASTT